MRDARTQQRAISIFLRRGMLCSILGSVCFLAGCHKETRNTFQAALAESTQSGYIVIEQSHADKSGYAVMSDSIHPKSKVAVILFAECHDDSYTGSHAAIPIWANVLEITYTLNNGSPSDVNFKPGKAQLHPVLPVKDIFEKWAPQWYQFSSAEGVRFTDDDKRGFGRAVTLLSQSQHSIRPAALLTNSHEDNLTRGSHSCTRCGNGSRIRLLVAFEAVVLPPSAPPITGYKETWPSWG